MCIRDRVHTMNNPFGIPDEVLVAMVNAAIQQKGQQTKSHTPENPNSNTRAGQMVISEWMDGDMYAVYPDFLRTKDPVIPWEQ